MRLRSLLLILIASAPAFAQPAERDHRGGPDVRDHRMLPPPPPGAIVGPTEAPPAPQAEIPGTKAGFEWVAGRWDWKGKWAWIPGHWERERAGKHWHPGAWAQHDGKWAYVEGQWAAGETAPPPPPPMPPPPTGAPPPPTGAPPPPPAPVEAPVVRDHREHREWKLELPVVSSYWPPRGKAGAHIMIRGRNFPNDAQVMWNGTQVTAARVQAEEIVFQVPAGATTGTITLHRAHGRDLPVGAFEVVAAGDPEGDARKADEERRKAAEAEWAAHQKELAKDRATRETAWHKHQDELDATRDQRRDQRMAELRAKWQAAFLADADTQSELTLHGQRIAQLERAKEIADLKADAKLGVRIDVALGKENARHDQRMSALETAFHTKGGTP
jgi:hypothetical protein